MTSYRWENIEFVEHFSVDSKQIKPNQTKSKTFYIVFSVQSQKSNQLYLTRVTPNSYSTEEHENGPQI